MSYFSLEPWGQVQADYRAGMICTTVARAMGGSKTAEPSHFFPLYSQRNKQLQTQEQQIEIFKRLAAVQG